MDAGRLGASVLYAKMQGNERFREELAKAKQEFAEKTGAAAGVKEVRSNVRSSLRAYTLAGTPATSEMRGIIIQDNKKIIRH